MDVAATRNPAVTSAAENPGAPGTTTDRQGRRLHLTNSKRVEEWAERGAQARGEARTAEDCEAEVPDYFRDGREAAAGEQAWQPLAVEDKTRRLAAERAEEQRRRADEERRQALSAARAEEELQKQQIEAVLAEPHAGQARLAGDLGLSPEQVLAHWREQYVRDVRKGRPAPPPPGTDPDSGEAADAKIDALRGCWRVSDLHGVSLPLLPPNDSEIDRLVGHLKTLRASGKGYLALSAAAFEVTDAVNSERAKPGNSIGVVPPISDEVVNRIAAVVAEIDPGHLPRPSKRPAASTKHGRLLALPPDRPARVGRHRLTAEAADNFNDLVADAAAIRLIGADPADEVRGRLARLPDAERLPADVVEELLRRIGEAEFADLARTVDAVRHPERELAVLRDLNKAAQDRAEAVRLGVLDDADGGFEIFSRTPADMHAARDEIKTDYLVGNMIVRGQYGTMIGPSKSGKTLCALGIGLYGAVGRDVWDSPAFKVSRPYRTLLLTRESDEGLILATIDSIAARFGVTHEDLGGFECTTRHPMVNNPKTLKSLRRRIEADKIDLVVLDPVTAGVVFPANAVADQILFYATMRPIVDAVQDGGGTLLITHHTVKEAGKRLRKTDLFDATGAGHDGWARFWVGVSRRSAYDPAKPGHHELHLATGISGGRGAAIDLTIDEYGQDGETRTWSAIATAPAKKARPSAKTSRTGPGGPDEDEAAGETRSAKETALEARRGHVLATLAGQPKPITPSALQKQTKGNRETVAKVCESLVEDGLAEVAGTNTNENPLYRVTEKGRARVASDEASAESSAT
jgi:hypothetical protein